MFNYFLKKFTKTIFRMLILLFLFSSMLILLFYLSYQKRDIYENPNSVYEHVIENKSNIYFNETNKKFLSDKNIWAIRLDEKGNVVESFNKPSNVKEKFDIKDIVRFTRYYLEDYPVFTYVIEDGIIIFAYPVGSLDKLPSNFYNYDSLLFVFKIFLLFIILFLVSIYVFYRMDIKSIYKKLFPIQKAIDNLYEDDYEVLDESGELRELSKTINYANKKYSDLKLSQIKWIRGVSHDLRTPLSKITWNLNNLKENYDESLINKTNEEVIKVSNIIEDLNLTMYLESVNKNKFTKENPIKILRKLIVEKINDNSNRDIDFKFNYEDINIYMDEHLFYRMIENVLSNSIKYTSGKISVILNASEGMFRIYIKDEGEGIDEEIIEKLQNSDISEVRTHGFGLFISKQICEIHNGNFRILNTNDGLNVIFEFKLDDVNKKL
ncbi:HAMP domain-containing histidine kinase [Peptoniphilus sp. MSJ-1]|uniref:histidine kinase n=2 Tax=Peptoniphilus ovalis TaxID=2841503 RepID=A0ABS6FHV0_9FIRM|nr:HAMP domain-containing sensor histidine kinase [Peptoniphilus ovalis]MBU5669755.1 HAMP domain-containing histidine kinase [Peptoniphilus ovalis]